MHDIPQELVHWLLSPLLGCEYAQTELCLSDFSSCDHNHLHLLPIPFSHVVHTYTTVCGVTRHCDRLKKTVLVTDLRHIFSFLSVFGRLSLNCLFHAF